MPIRAAIVGLGAVGQRMLTNMRAHERFTVVGVWDADPAAVRRTLEAAKEIKPVDGADALFQRADVELVYIGVPPLAHREYVERAIAAGKAVFCEKPLGIDIAESRKLVEAVEKSGLRHAVNFSLASAPSVETIEKAIESGRVGRIAGADIRLHFSKWPRDFQAHASWLQRRDQGGFVREVLSHFVYLADRLFGEIHLSSSDIRYPKSDPESSEKQALARFEAGDIPVTVAGSVGGAGPDQVEFTVWGEKASYRLRDWYSLDQATNGEWNEVPSTSANPRLDAYMRQLTNLALMMEGKPHPLPGFRVGLAVQNIIERMLGR
jgi:predicted dehydrogenase